MRRFLGRSKPTSTDRADAALAEMRADPDIAAEATAATAATAPAAAAALDEPDEFVPLNIVGRAHEANAHTARLLDQAGGFPALLKFTRRFYEKAFADPHINKFLRSEDDPHGERFASWIAEKFGDPSRPWTAERQQRPVCPYSVRGVQLDVHDRSSAHFAAWHSPHREPHKFGQHFNLQDCRIWMRLHFWAMRESGLLEQSPGFADYYVRFIGHFVRVYERTAPTFARDAVRWSANQENIERYLETRQMPDAAAALPQALAQLPREEAQDMSWPYNA